jgi:DNA-binding transcriptional LysR family regulator
MAELIADAARRGHKVRVAPYVLAHPGPERRTDLDLIRRYTGEVGWQVTLSSFADVGQPPPLTERPGFTAACRYAAQGYAHGILAIARPALTTDDDTYARVLDHLYVRRVFLTYLPTTQATT